MSRVLFSNHRRKLVIYVTSVVSLICKFRLRGTLAINGMLHRRITRCFRKFPIDSKPVVRARRWKPFMRWHKWFWLTRLVISVCSDVKH